MELYLQWMGCGLGALGSFLLALNRPFSGWGFVLFLASNAFWIAYALLVPTPGLLIMQIAFTGTSLLGIWRWLFSSQPERAGFRVRKLEAEG